MDNEYFICVQTLLQLEGPVWTTVMLLPNVEFTHSCFYTRLTPETYFSALSEHS